MTGLMSPTVLVLGGLVSSPALMAAFVDHTLPVQTALVRFAVACLVCWVGLSLLDSMLRSTAAEDGSPAAIGGGSDGAAVEATAVLPPEDRAA